MFLACHDRPSARTANRKVSQVTLAPAASVGSLALHSAPAAIPRTASGPGKRGCRWCRRADECRKRPRSWTHSRHGRYWLLCSRQVQPIASRNDRFTGIRGDLRQVQRGQVQNSRRGRISIHGWFRERSHPRLNLDRTRGRFSLSVDRLWWRRSERQRHRGPRRAINLRRGWLRRNAFGLNARGFGRHRRRCRSRRGYRGRWRRGLADRDGLGLHRFADRNGLRLSSGCRRFRYGGIGFGTRRLFRRDRKVRDNGGLARRRRGHRAAERDRIQVVSEEIIVRRRRWSDRLGYGLSPGRNDGRDRLGHWLRRWSDGLGCGLSLRRCNGYGRLRRWLRLFRGLGRRFRLSREGSATPTAYVGGIALQPAPFTKHSRSPGRIRRTQSSGRRASPNCKSPALSPVIAHAYPARDRLRPVGALPFAPIYDRGRNRHPRVLGPTDRQSIIAVENGRVNAPIRKLSLSVRVTFAILAVACLKTPDTHWLVPAHDGRRALRGWSDRGWALRSFARASPFIQSSYIPFGRKTTCQTSSSKRAPISSWQSA